MDLEELVAIVGDTKYRYRIGLYETEDVRPAALELMAAQYQLKLFDVARAVLDTIPSGSRYAGLNDNLLRRILKDCTERFEDRSIVLWSNADVVLSRLSTEQRSHLWQYALAGIPRPPTGVIIAVPHASPELILFGEQLEWQGKLRFATSST